MPLATRSMQQQHFWGDKAGRLAAVVAVHAALIYAVATSLGIVETPFKAEPMEAVMIEDAPLVREKPAPVVKPDLTEPTLDVAVPDPVVDVPLEEAPPLETAIVAEPTPSEPIASAELSVTRRTDPVYPDASRRVGEQGTVTLRVLVDERGLPREVVLDRSSGHSRLDAAAAEAIRKWRFAAAVRNGVAAAAWTTVRVTFRLDQA